MAQSAAQKRAQQRLSAAAKEASRKGLKGNAFRAFVAKKTKGKGGGGKGKKPAKKPKSNPRGGGGGGGGSTALTKHRPRGGATYQAVKVTAQAAVPVTDYALVPAQQKSVNGLIAHVRQRANLELGKGYAVAAVDYAASKHRFVGHAAALSRLSVTAIAPEAYLFLKGVEDVRAGANARQVHARGAVATMGYDPTVGRQSFRFQRFQTYHKAKWLGALARYIANRTRIGRSITRPIRENVLRELGGSV